MNHLPSLDHAPYSGTIYPVYLLYVFVVCSSSVAKEILDIIKKKICDLKQEMYAEAYSCLHYALKTLSLGTDADINVCFKTLFSENWFYF